MYVLVIPVIVLLTNVAIVYAILKKIKAKKWNKNTVVIGALWGLANEIFYAWLLFAAAFSNAGWDGGLLSRYSQAHYIWQILFLPMYIVDRLIFSPVMSLVPYDFTSVHPILQLSYFLVVLPLVISMILLAGIAISAGIGHAISKFRQTNGS